MSEVKKQGFIYSLRSRSRPDLVYIGSTTSSLAKRKGGHWSHFALWKAGKYHFTTSFNVLEVAHELGDRTDCYIELIRTVDYDCKAELNREEGIEIRRTICVNKFIPGRTDSEYYIDHREETREQRIEYGRQYEAEHREAVNAKQREKVPCTCCETTVTRGGWSSHLKSLTHIKNAQEIA